MEPLRVTDMMSRRVETLSEWEECSVDSLLRRFRQFHHLPVLDRERRVVGMVTPADVLYASMRSQSIRVRDVMTSPAVTVDARAPVEAAAKQMVEERIHSLPVVGRSGELLGIVTGTDLMRALAGAHPPPARPGDVPVDSVMTHDPMALEPDATIADAAALMVDAGIRHVPIVDPNGTVVGIVSDRDLREHLRGDVARWPQAPADRLDEPISSVMTPNPVALLSGTSIRGALEGFTDERVSALPVVDEQDRLLGIVSYVDLLDWIRREEAARKERAAQPAPPVESDLWSPP
jgi:CBS domain-containing protein